MKRPTHHLGWPLSRLTVAIPALLIFVVALLAKDDVSDSLNLPYQIWVTTSAQFHEKLLLAGPIAAAAANFYAGRVDVPSRLFGQPWAPRSGSQNFLRHLREMSWAFCAAYTAGLAPLTCMTVIRSGAGGPNVLTMLSGLLGLVALVVIGYGVGIFARTSWTSPLVLVAVFILMQSTTFNPTLRFVVPVTHSPPLLGEVESVAGTTYRISFFVAVACGLGLLVARALARPRRLGKPSIVGMIVLAILAGAIAAPILLQPRLIVGESDRPHSCSTVGKVQYCVHSGRSSQLSAMKAAAQSVFSITGVPKQLHQVTDAALVVDNNSKVGRETVVVGLYPDESTVGYTARAVAQRTTDACPPPDGRGSERAVIGDELTDAVLHNVGVSTGIGRQSSPFDRLSRRQLHTWWTKHATAIDKCALTKKLLP